MRMREFSEICEREGTTSEGDGGQDVTRQRADIMAYFPWATEDDGGH
jgi:hypothetical protein